MIQDVGEALWDALNDLGVPLPEWGQIPGGEVPTERFADMRFQSFGGYEVVDRNYMCHGVLAGEKWGDSRLSFMFPPGGKGSTAPSWVVGGDTVDADPLGEHETSPLVYGPAYWGTHDFQLRIGLSNPNPLNNDILSFGVIWRRTSGPLGGEVGTPIGEAWVGELADPIPSTPAKPVYIGFPEVKPWPVWIVPRPRDPMYDEEGNGDTSPRPQRPDVPSTYPTPQRPDDPRTDGPIPPVIVVPPTVLRPPGPGERERKFRFKPGLYSAYETARWALHGLTEAQDLVNAIWDALPGSVKSGKTRGPNGVFVQKDIGPKGLPEKFMDIYNNLDKVNWSQAIHNIVKNEIEDQLIGRGLGKLDKAAKNLGLPSGYRLNNIVWQLLDAAS